MVSPYFLRCIVFGALVLTVFATDTKSGTNRDRDDLATRISEDLDQRLGGIMESQPIKYTTVNTTGLPYNATTKFNSKGMGQLYNVTNIFIDFIQSKQAFPEGLIWNDETNPRQLKFADPRVEWRSIVTHYGGLTGLAVTGLILAAILPCVGLFFCCCRCAGHCGARSQPFDKKHDHCRKVMLSILLIGVVTILLFGVVCAFVTNEYMQEGIEALPSNVEVSLKDAELYLTTTKKQINTVLKKNFNELEDKLNHILQASGEIVTEELADYSHAVSLTNLNDIVTGLDDTKQDLQIINNVTKELRGNATDLSNAVRSVKNNLQEILKNCKNPICERLMHDQVSPMDVTIDYDKLGNVSAQLHNISLLIDDNIVSEVSEGRKSFLKIQDNIQREVNQTIPTVSNRVKNAGDYLANVSNNISSLIDRINRDINRVYIPNLKYAQDAIDQYSMYRYYLGLGVSGVLLTVLMCLTSGLFCGICGKRPDGYGDDCCNKGSGARFLMLAVWIIFLLMSVLMVITSALMIIGVVTQRGVCELLKNPEENRMFKLVDNYVQVNRLLYPDKPEADINLTWILTKCHANESLYEVLKLKNLMDIDLSRDYIERFSINSAVDQLTDRINLSPEIVILSDRATEKLNNLAQIELSNIKFYQYTELLKNNITNINLNDLANNLDTVANRLDGDIQTNLKSNARLLRVYHGQYVVRMTEASEQLSTSALKIEERIKFKHGSMSEAIHNLIDEVKAAQRFLNEEGPIYVQQLATKFSKAVLLQVSNYLEHLIASAHKQIGKCGPLSNAFNATVVAGCNKILDPFNGFWTSVGWCLIMFIPTIILCVKLSALYQKSDPYPGPLVESEYLYDAYADRDNMPLAHVHDKKHSGHSRHYPNAYVESYDGPAGTTAAYSGRERVADAHQGSSHHESRYSDHAPNSAVSWHRHDRVASSKPESQNKVYSIPLDTQNWDFPNGGPPRYQPPPGAPPLSTEYERPPPYYYPGPGDRN